MLALYRYNFIIIIISSYYSYSFSFSFSSSSSFNEYYYYCYYYLYYSEHKDAIHNKGSNITSKKESDASLSTNVHKLASPFSPGHSETLSIWESSKSLNEGPLFQDRFSSNFNQDYTQNASTNWGVGSENVGVSQWNPQKQTFSSLQIHESLHLTSSSVGSHRSKSTPRPYPENVNSKTPFQICKHYASGMRCRETCTFAHGEEELSQWTMQRDKGV